MLITLIGIKNYKSRISDPFKIDNKFTKDSNKIANKFCEYFSGMGKTFGSKMPYPDKSFHYHLKYTANYQRSMFMLPTDPEEVSRIITSLKSYKSSSKTSSM